MTRCVRIICHGAAFVFLICCPSQASRGIEPVNPSAGPAQSVDAYTPMGDGSARHIVFPDQQWETRTPDQVGLDPAKIDAFAEAVGGSGVIVRDGYLVKSWGDPSKRGDWASSSKPVMSTLLFFAVQEGRLAGVDAPVRPWVQKRWPGKDLIEKDHAMTFRHLADMVSGYARAEPPGTHWAYNDYAIQLYGEILSEVLGDKTLSDAAVKRLAALQLQDGGLFGSRRGLGLDASARDFARLGWLWLNHGLWKENQILNQTIVDKYLSYDVPPDLPRTQAAGRDYLEIGSHGGRGIQNRGGGSDQTEMGPGVYGFNWWFNAPLPGNPDTLLMPCLPRDAFQANGHWGKEVMLIVPSWQLIVAARGDWGGLALAKTRLLADAVVAEHNCSAGEPREDRPSQESFAKWTKIELAFRGPSTGQEGAPNPFAVAIDVTFTSPSSRQFSVPGFFDGNGKGSPDGNIWKVRFSADEVGPWSYVTTSSSEQLNGHSGSFHVTDVPAEQVGFWKWGRLESVGTPQDHIRYLKFRDGPYWLKAGCDDPENFLGDSQNFNTLQKRKDAVDYLAARGINSLYMMLHNIRGDNNDVWPWLGDTPEEARKHAGEDARFDLVRLEQWRELFEYMQSKGVVPYLILEDDSAWKGYDHARYYREVIARFGYLPALLLNIGEEQNENYRLAESLDLAQQLRETDPYDHPCGLHNVNEPDDRYVDAQQVSFTSIQTGSPDATAPDPLSHNQLAIDWIEKCRARGRRALMINFDEGRPELDRRAWWSAYLGGGVWEAHVLGPYDRPLSTWEKTWVELGGTRAFMESIPFWEMTPCNELVKTGQAFCLAKPGACYALYLPHGGTVTVELASGRTYETSWWQPDSGYDGRFQPSMRIEGGRQQFTAPAAGDWALRIVASPPDAGAAHESTGLSVRNGWYVHHGKVVWGYCQHNGWWRPGQRPNLARNAPGHIGPNRTEDLDQLTDAMLRFGYPAFEHNYGLWFDRRRDQHDAERRDNADVVPPFLEQPWARSESGTAWDGLPKYDLTRFNDWYFDRLRQFASLCDRKGTVLIHCCYMQHALLELQAHYADFPWRPVNCLQDTGMPDQFPAAGDFYDVSHPLRRDLHRSYIRHCLNVLGRHTNVVFLCSEEYTGPLSFMQFWLDTIDQWERETGCDVHVGVSATKEVVDAIMADPKRSCLVSTIDLRGWWYEADGRLFAPQGGVDVAGRYAGEITRTTPAQIHRQVTEYRRQHPAQALIHGLPGTRQHAWAALTGGASLLVGQLPYPEKQDPPEYISPELCQEIQTTYDFIRTHLAAELPRMVPLDALIRSEHDVWCLADPDRAYLLYGTEPAPFVLDLTAATGSFEASWFDPQTGQVTRLGTLDGAATHSLHAPGQGDWALLLAR